jgi:hypothetical protein
MYVVSQITPLEWSKAAVCNHYDDVVNDNEFHLCKNSLNSLDGHEDFMMSATAVATTEFDGRGNCGENYSTLERYLKNVSELSEENEAWMNIEYRKHFLEQQKHQQRSQHHHHQHQCEEERKFGSTRNLDIDDDGLIGFEEVRRDSFSTFDNEEHEAASNIELISYENNFNLKNSFWWAMGTLIQTSTDLYPKVLCVVTIIFCVLFFVVDNLTRIDDK